MVSEKLTSRERAILLVLMAEAREISNPELGERVGLKLDGPSRLKLNRLKLVESTKQGRAYVHELTDAGWRRCAEELRSSPGDRPLAMERALYRVLAGLGRYLERSSQAISDIFAPPNAELGRDEIRTRITKAYLSQASDAGDYINLSALRMAIPEVGREALDDVLGEMYRAQEINLIPRSNQRAITDIDRKLALRIGGEDKHMISIHDPMGVS